MYRLLDTEKTERRSVVFGKLSPRLAGREEPLKRITADRTRHILSIFPEACRARIPELFQRVAVVMDIESRHDSDFRREDLNMVL